MKFKIFPSFFLTLSCILCKIFRNNDFSFVELCEFNEFSVAKNLLGVIALRGSSLNIIINYIDYWHYFLNYEKKNHTRDQRRRVFRRTSLLEKLWKCESNLLKTLSFYDSHRYSQINYSFFLLHFFSVISANMFDSSSILP